MTQDNHYSQYGFGNNMVLANRPGTIGGVTGVAFDSKYDVQSRKVFSSNALQNSNIATGAFSLNTGESGFVRFTYVYAQNQKTFGLPFISVYTGTSAVSANKVYVRFGSNIANSKFSLHSGFDYLVWDKVNSNYTVNIENNSGTTSSFYTEGQWKALRLIGAPEQL